MICNEYHSNDTPAWIVYLEGRDAKIMENIVEEYKNSLNLKP